MSRVARLRRRLHGAETLASVVGTMKTLASLRIGQYRRSVTALEASSRTLELALEALLWHHPELTLAGTRPHDEASDVALPAVVVVVGSDRGLCGPFAERIARHADGLLRHRTKGGPPPTLLAVGRRATGRLQGLGWEVAVTVAPPGTLAGVDRAGAEVLEHVDRWRDEGRAERLFLVHARPTGEVGYEPTALQLLPLDPSWLRALAGRRWPTHRLPLLGDASERLLPGVVRQLSAHALVRAFAASLAAENAARFAAMEAAERNVDDRIQELRTAYRSARQAAATEELLDIQAAYSASASPGPLRDA